MANKSWTREIIQLIFAIHYSSHLVSNSQFIWTLFHIQWLVGQRSRIRPMRGPDISNLDQSGLNQWELMIVLLSNATEGGDFFASILKTIKSWRAKKEDNLFLRFLAGYFFILFISLNFPWNWIKFK